MHNIKKIREAEIRDTQNLFHTPEIAAKLKKKTVGIAGSGVAGYGKNSAIIELETGRLRIMGVGVSEALPGIPLMAPRVGIISALLHEYNNLTVLSTSSPILYSI